MHGIFSPKCRIVRKRCVPAGPIDWAPSTANPRRFSTEGALVVQLRGIKGEAVESQFHYMVPASEGAWSAHRFMVEATTTDFWFAMYCGNPPGPYSGTIWYDDFYLGEFPASPAKGK
jgi:hypothetical protein